MDENVNSQSLLFIETIQGQHIQSQQVHDACNIQ